VTLTITELTGVAEHQRGAELIAKIWRRELLEPGLITTIAHVGGYVAGAWSGGELIGVSVGFFAADGHLHSHITGVLPGARGGAGYALKRHQREWALARGVRQVSWTFDPLVSRNAYLNFHKLGARAAAYLPDFYGEMRDAINAGEATDRIYVEWDLTAEPGGRPEPDLDGALVLLGRDGEEPVPTGNRPEPGRRAVVAMPRDVERLRADAPGVARRWRHAVRETLAHAAEAGLVIVDVARDGWYVLGDGTRFDHSQPYP
jgi:predicted GNAT superfamily acetyltransferase